MFKTTEPANKLEAYKLGFLKISKVQGFHHIAFAHCLQDGIPSLSVALNEVGLHSIVKHCAFAPSKFIVVVASHDYILKVHINKCIMVNNVM